MSNISPGLHSLAVPIRDLVPDPTNARSHSNEAGVDALAASLARFGQQKPVIVRRNESGALVVIAGNGILLAAQRLGWTEVAVVETQLNGDEARAYAIADNRVAELSDWDPVVLAAQLREIEEVAGIGFSDAEISAYLGAGTIFDAAAAFDSIAGLDAEEEQEKSPLNPEAITDTTILLTGPVEVIDRLRLAAQEIRRREGLPTLAHAIDHALSGRKDGL